MDITLLHKKLTNPWTAGLISKSIASTATLEELTALISTEKLERKIKLRILLALLNFEAKDLKICSNAIEKLLQSISVSAKSGNDKVS